MAIGDPPVYNLSDFLRPEIQRWTILEQDVRGKLREVNHRLSQHYAGEIGLCAELNGEAMGYASILDLIHVHMRELGILYA